MKIFLFFLLFAGLAFTVIKYFKKAGVLYICRFIKRKTGYLVTISDVKISTKGISFKNIVLEKGSFRVDVDFIRIGLAKHPHFIYLYIRSLNFYHSPLGQSSPKAQDTTKAKLTSPLIKNILKKFTNLFGRKYPKVLEYTMLKVDNFRFFYRDHTNPIAVVEDLSFEKQRIIFNLCFFVSLKSKYKMVVRFNRSKIVYSLTNLVANNSDDIYLPYLTGKITISLDQHFTINMFARKGILNNEKIANQPLMLKDVSMTLIVSLFNDRLVLIPDSYFQFNAITVDIKGHLNYEDDLLSMLIYLTTKVENLIEFIPSQKDNPLKGFKSEGQICIGVSYGFLWSDPLHYKFNLDYNFEDFKILSPGIDLLYLQNEFSFTSYINPANHCTVSVLNPNDYIEHKSLLGKIIQLSEDPNFYKHKGVDIYSVGVAVANNLAQKKFYKGASTLTMQLVKNLFLGEDKSVTRKLEELILTLLLENHFNISKERILNIYLQIIEFGPKIYGIIDASAFYFNKEVKELTLLECLVLSYIVPRPRFFLEALLAKSEQLDQNLSQHIERKVGQLIARKMITKEEFQAINRKINFFNIGEFELTNLNIPKLENLLVRVN